MSGRNRTKVGPAHPDRRENPCVFTAWHFLGSVWERASQPIRAKADQERRNALSIEAIHGLIRERGKTETPCRNRRGGGSVEGRTRGVSTRIRGPKIGLITKRYCLEGFCEITGKAEIQRCPVCFYRGRPHPPFPREGESTLLYLSRDVQGKRLVWQTKDEEEEGLC